MKTVRYSFLVVAVTLIGLLSCNKSDLTKTINNTTAGGNASAGATGAGACGVHDCVYTQGGYGAPNGGPHGFMYANFYKAFPNGFPVGSFGPNKCANGYRVFMSSPEDVTATLPVGGPPAVLTKNYKDKAPKNVLVGQLITLCLNLGLEPYCPTYDPAHPLTAMIIASGPFQGMTVNNFFELAGSVLGGCNNMYTPAQVNETATKINENYEGGNKGFLTCP